MRFYQMTRSDNGRFVLVGSSLDADEAYRIVCRIIEIHGYYPDCYRLVETFSGGGESGRTFFGFEEEYSF